MTHWCFSCEKYPTQKEYDICKEQDHDVDFEDQFKPGKGEQKPKEEQSQAKKLLKFATPQIKKIVISDSDSSEIYGLVKVEKHLESIEIGSTRSIDWLKAKYFDQTKDIFSEESYKSALGMIKAKARFMKSEKEIIYKRCAFVGGCIYYDLCSPDWKIVKISKDSIEIIPCSVSTPTFARSKNQTQQVEPTLCPSENALDRFYKLLRTENELIKNHLPIIFVESIPVPIIAHVGQQGSLKSTQSALIKMLVDPTGTNIADQLTHLPKKSEDLNLILANNYYVAFDNVSDIDSEQSDIFCKTITGATFARRQLYTMSELGILKIRRKFGLNGITLDIKNGDLQERTIIYQTGKVLKSERKTESKVLEEFRHIQSDVLGSIFLVLQKALRIVEDVELELKDKPRMADFAIWGEAVSQSLGNDTGKFIEWYNEEIDSGIDTLSEGTPLVPFLEEYLDDKQNNPNQAQIFYSIFKKYAEENQYDKSVLPKASNKLRGYVRKCQPILEKEGYEIEFFRNTATNQFKIGSTLIEIRKVSSVSSEPSERTEHTEHTEGKITTFTEEEN